MVALYQLADTQLLQACTVSHGKARGPGGQHVHSHASAVTLTLEIPSIQVQCQDFRSAADNQKRALRELRIRLALAERGASDRDLFKKYLRNNKIQINPDNPEFSFIVAVIFDVLDDCDYDLSQAASELSTSASQLAKVCGLHKLVWKHLQDKRKALGLNPLKHR